MPDLEGTSLEQDVKTMIREVRVLTSTLAEYPKRQEVHEKYVSRRESKQRIALVMVVLLFSLAVSYFVTISTVSTCFLGGDDSHPGLCTLIPGYDEAQQRNTDILKQFQELVKITERNDQRLDRIEQQGLTP